MRRKRTTRIHYAPIRPKTAVRHFIYYHWKIILFTLIFLFGIVCGTFLMQNLTAAQMEKVSGILEVQLAEKQSQTFLKALVNALISFLGYALAGFLFGLCALGEPFVLLLPFVRGLGAGLFFSYLYTQFAWKGVSYAALVCAPGLALSVGILLYCCQESLSLSSDILRALNKNKESPTVNSSVSLYCKRYIAYVILLCSIALLDAGLSTLLSPLLALV